MDPKKERDALLAKAMEILQVAEKAGKGLSDEDRTELKRIESEVEQKNAEIQRASDDTALLGRLKGLGGGSFTPEHAGGSKDEKGDDGVVRGAHSLGDFFIKSVGDDYLRNIGRKGATVSAPEFEYKAATDTVTVGTSESWPAGVPILTDYDRTQVREKRERPVVASLLGTGTISGNAISYLVEGSMEGDFATVAEGAAKPQISYTKPTQRIDALKKIAGWIHLTDEFLEDLPFLKSEIDTRLMHMLRMFEERQLLNGDGTGQNILGIRNRSGIQTEAGLSEADDVEALFRAMTKISTATDLSATGLMINPMDYQRFRLSKDGNGQYMGGGYFQGQYGNGTVMDQPNLWGLPTVVTPAIEQGKALVGAFNLAATVYRKGGVRVEATNTHADDFTNNLVTVRAEERIALACRYPAGIVEVSFFVPTPTP